MSTSRKEISTLEKENKNLKRQIRKLQRFIEKNSNYFPEDIHIEKNEEIEIEEKPIVKKKICENCGGEVKDIPVMNYVFEICQVCKARKKIK